MSAVLPQRRQWTQGTLELGVLLVLASLAFASVPWTLGRLGLSFDTLNHHIYLGWLADGSRLERDYLGAATQSTQFPYLYWPVYRLATANVSGTVAGTALALLHVLAVPPVWWIARLLLPQRDLAGAALRVSAVALGFMSAVPLKTLESTGNDFLAAIPVLWAIAFALYVVQRSQAQGGWNAVVASGVMGGIAVALKLSNGPLVALLPIVFAFAPGDARRRLLLALACGVAMAVGFVVTYGYWGWQLWRVFGNPVYPFAEGVFAWVREIAGWTP